ncbi:hypothetical protein VP01_6406g1, partial [Puccinia sorghi]
TIVQLTTHAPSITDLLDFNDWVYVGKAGFYIQMEPQYKEFFFENLVTWSNLSLIMADYPRRYDSRCLVKSVDWTISIITLDMSQRTMESITGLILVSMWKQRDYEDKVYSRLVHALKSTSTKHVSSGPTNTRMWHSQLNSIENKLLKMKHSPQLKLGGYQIELSIHAPSYIAAYVFANCKTGYLNPIKSRNLWTIKVNSLSMPKDKYFDYVMKMISLARDKLNVRKKHDKIIKLEQIQKIGLGDVANALGWNLGPICGPKWNDPLAWWKKPSKFIKMC